ncbi:MAG: 2TM domain-containing protein [Rhodomicrobiaceae bacterium]|jgi:hypothetical protein
MDPYEQAKKRVEAKIGFFIHLIIYIFVNGILAVVDIAASPDKLWFYWPLAGWGIGVLMHGIAAFHHPHPKKQHGSFKERMIEKELQAIKKSTASDKSTDKTE